MEIITAARNVTTQLLLHLYRKGLFGMVPPIVAIAIV